MIRVLIISDFTESFSHKLLAGIVDYSRQKEQWIVRRMPPEYKAQIGIQGVIRVALKYNAVKEQVISGLRRVSKPGLRVYAGADDLPKVLKGLGIAIVSTSKGIMTDKKARELHIGGEVLAFVW